MMTYFISDTHFGESEDGFYVLGRENDFIDKNDMIQKLTENWNAVVSENDTVYHLGDVFWGMTDKERKQVLSNLLGHKILVMGNHDRDYPVEYWREIGFEKVYDVPILYNGSFLLSHEPIYLNYGSIINVFGHVHINTIYKDYSPTHFCACVERINYTPVAEGYIRKCISNVRKSEFCKEAEKERR